MEQVTVRELPFSNFKKNLSENVITGKNRGVDVSIDSELDGRIAGPESRSRRPSSCQFKSPSSNTTAI